ncbi:MULTISPECIES: TonB-dependent receptor [unclassified Pseudoalteromonas]|uniref:TonB-dependent receptor n=1 Tax=unclassified Pseudoalteromonas TaxID=194690 RepID=UPI0025B5F6D7|nr:MULTISPECIES: TonB-dependent receptor [unclassified Pseudoalteromonas]MDN3380584.1 TonB-dependent receptor [Pseudoalteromonas sp. APC 3893]MDN3388884.1 TonB-dependent receptor [Pseudoalteromonas sp. APC 4017]
MPRAALNLATIVTCLLIATPSLSLAEQAATASQLRMIKLDLPAGKLGDVLTLFSRQAGVTLSFEEHSVRDYSVAAIIGEYTAATALQQLLKNTDLQALPISNSAWLVQQKNQQGLITLSAINVQSSRVDIKDQTYTEAASVNSITQQDIERFRGTSVGDIFQGTPGVLISENRNSGGLDVNIRGMQGQGRVPVVIDGSRQETTVYRGYSGVSSRSYIDPDLIGSLKISKGPVMSADGTGATGGLVSVSTLTAEDIIKEGELTGFRVRASAIGNSSNSPKPGTYAGYYLPRNAYRSECRFSSYCTDQFIMPASFAPQEGMDRPSLFEFGGSYAGSFAAAKHFTWGDLIAAYAKREQGNYYAGSNGPTPQIIYGEPDKLAWYTETAVSTEGASRFRANERIPNTNFSSESWLLKSSILLPDDQSLEMSYIRYNSAYGEMMPSQIRSFGQARQWLDSEVTNQTYTLRYRWQPIKYDWADFKANFWHTDALTRLNTPGVGSVDIANNVARSDDYQRFGADISNTMMFYSLGELALNYGLAAQYEDMDTDTPETEGFYVGSRSGWRKEFSAFSAIDWQLTKKWTLQAGLRFTHFSSKDNNPLSLTTNDPACIPNGSDGCLAVQYENSHSGTAPLVALKWHAFKGLQFYIRHSEALRMPSLFESTSGWSVSPVLDIPLEPEHATNQELGLNYLNDSLLKDNYKIGFKLAYFQNHVDDYLTRTQPNAWEQKQGGLDFFRMRNIDSLDLNGWELNFSYNTQYWLAELSGTHYTHIEVCNVGSYVRYYCNDWGLPESYINNMIPPNWHASAHVGVRLFEQRLEAGLRATFMGERNSIPRYNAPTGFNEPVLWHSYNLLDIYASYKFNDNTTIDFTIDNITDRYYLDALSLGLVPAPGRTARLSLTLQF